MRESSLTVFEAFAASAQENGDRPFLAVLPDVADAYGIVAERLATIDGLPAALARAKAAQKPRIIEISVE